MSQRTVIFDSSEVQDEFNGKLGHFLYIYWPKGKVGEPVEGDVIEIVKEERMVLVEEMGKAACEPGKRWRWRVVKTERSSRGEFGPSDHLLVLVK